MGIITNKPGRQNIRKLGRKGKLYKPYGFGQEGAAPVSRLVLTWNGIDSYGRPSDMDATGQDFTFSCSFSVAGSANDLQRIFGQINQNAGVEVLELGSLRFIGLDGSIAQSAQGVIVVGVDYDMVITWVDATKTAVVTLNNVEVINQAITAGWGIVNGIAARSGSTRLLNGIIKDVSMVFSAESYFWAIDSGSIVSEESTADPNTLVFFNVVAGDWGPE